MQVTEVRLELLEDKGRLKAVSSVTVDNEFVIHDVKVIEGETSTFISFPSRKNKEGEFVDICHPINQSARNKIQEAVIDAYENALKEQQESSNE